MGNKINGLLGISLASIIIGFRQGTRALRKASRKSTENMDPLGSAALHSLPEITLAEMLGGNKPIIVAQIQGYEDGALYWNEMVALLSLLAVVNPSSVLEIGTYMGSTTRAIARGLPNAVVHTLDLPLDESAMASDPSLPKDDFHLIAKRKPGRDFIGTPEAARIRQHFGDSAKWDYSQVAGTNCFFIDGSHTYEYCRADTEKCYELCGGKGVFIWHDCDDGHPGVVKFLAEWRRGGRQIVRIKETHIAYWDGR
jgi:hypothetical protein